MKKYIVVYRHKQDRFPLFLVDRPTLCMNGGGTQTTGSTCLRKEATPVTLERARELVNDCNPAWEGTIEEI